MSHRSHDATQYLDHLARRIGATRAVVASADGLLVAGSSAAPEALEELAAYAPSQLPARVERPTGLSTRRLEVHGQRLYVAALGAAPPAEAAQELARILGS